MRWSFLVEKYGTVTNVVGTIVVAWLLSAVVGQAIALFLPDTSASQAKSASRTPAPALTRSNQGAATLAYYMPICERNIFDSLQRTACSEDIFEEEEQVSSGPVSGDAPVKSDISATLLGTTVSTIADRSFATIADKGGKESDNYHIDDTFLGEARIYDIQRNIVFFVRNSRREYLEVDNLPNIYVPAATAAKPSPDKGVKMDGDRAVVSREKVEATLGDLNKIIQQARMVPNYQGGKVNGFKIFAIRRDSIFEQLGLKNGDVIQRINGTEINSVEKAIPMLQLARSESNITIDLTRRGVKKSLSIDIQ